jgi:pantoate--beta-alanine ligase
MGALHAGHVSLVEQAKLQSDIVAATIFVNPTQFGPKEDFGKYPRTLESDLEKLDAVGCDIVFVPSSEQVYAPEHSTYIDPPKVANRWEGEIRPGHFRGVTTVVLKLFMMVPAQVAFFGRKDYQQVAVIRAMVEDLNLPIQIVTCDTIRESDGLAMSSRNRYLNDSERSRALSLSRALKAANAMVEAGCRNVSDIENEMMKMLLDAPVDSIDYARIVDGDTLEPLSELTSPAIAIIAARLGTTRLIDNCILR